MGDSGAQALAGLKNAAALHTLTLNLWHNNVGDSGAEALAGLKNAATLHTLTLNLWYNNVGASGVQALAGLKNARTARYEQENSFVFRAASYATHVEPCFE